ncbi:hypothetical protein SMD20_43430 [Nonomuraea sp. LP-02]|uniref:hypothetical protein n=1 Tax=Nonomuraea sp. LP-02 TaxID=3097960 RepID=UPI002E2F1B73|nr:hypothetical protein [Nonomuraea sp. LP-02]MED7931137.1 hypothetical protein [Nonomuraea sp. LP-02]
MSDDAYATQAALLGRRHARGEQGVGLKLGLTNSPRCARWVSTRSTWATAPSRCGSATAATEAVPLRPGPVSAEVACLECVRAVVVAVHQLPHPHLLIEIQAVAHLPGTPQEEAQ